MNNKWIKSCAVFFIGGLMLWSGCASTMNPSDLRIKYQVGQVQHARWTDSKTYKTWVEMPGKDPTEPDFRQTKQEYEFKQQVESVEPDGTAIVKITIEKAVMTLNSKVQGKTNKSEYRSERKSFKSTWPGEPRLTGMSYEIKVAPDSTVLQVIGLDDLRKKLNLKENDHKVAGELIKVENLKKYHQHSFLIDSPDVVKGTVSGAALPSTYEKDVAVPDVMIKAKAIKKTYTLAGVKKANGKSLATITYNGKALYVLPEGVPKPEEPNNFGQTMIKSMSSMDKLDIKGQGVFDLTDHQVISETNNIACTLIILEENIAMGQQKKKKAPGTGGTMFTTIDVKQTFELLK